MVMLMVLIRWPKIMGRLVVSGPFTGWAVAATVAMAFGMVATMFIGSLS